jgi:arginase
MQRRQFLLDTAALLASQILATQSLGQVSKMADGKRATYHVLGVPLRAGSLLPGNEDDAQAYREAHFVERLQAAGCDVIDDGNVKIPSYLPHHSIPPIRSWPAPRIAWECVAERVAPLLQQPGQIPLLIGCDCSVVIGTTQALIESSSQKPYVLYVDGDFDDSPPQAAQCQSAASCAVWLLTHNSPFWIGPPLQSPQVSVIGWSNPSRAGESGIGSISLAETRRSGPAEAARLALRTVPSSSSILLHFDIDVLARRDMPAAYFPHRQGLSLPEATELLSVLARDPRIRIIEISEYAALRDLDHDHVNKLIDLLATSLSSNRT